MSLTTLSVGEELETIITDDFGFKPVNSTLLNLVTTSKGGNHETEDKSRKIPYVNQRCLSINEKYFIVSDGLTSHVRIGELDKLRSKLFNNNVEEDNDDIPFLFDNELPNDTIISVESFTDNVNIFYVITQLGKIYQLDISTGVKNDWGQSSKSLNTNIAMCKKQNGSLIILCENGDLLQYNVSTSALTTVANNVEYFDILQTEKIVYSINTEIYIYSVKSKCVVQKFSVSIDAEEEYDNGEQEQPEPLKCLVVEFISNKTFLVVYGTTDTNSEDGDFYNHKIFIIDIENNSVEQTYDVIPPFAQSLRKPTLYKAICVNLNNTYKETVVFASSCSSELSIITVETASNKIATQIPDQDSNRAILPMDPVTDNDTTPIGMALDCWNTDLPILSPCPGVDSATELPLIYVLNNLGQLQAFALFSMQSIKDTTLSLKDTIKLYSGDYFSNTEVEHAITSLDSNLINDSDKLKSSTPNIGLIGDATVESPFDKPVFGAPSFGFNATNNNAESPFGKPAFGAPSFGSNATNNNAESPFGKPAFGTSTATDETKESPFSKPVFGASSFGTSTDTDENKESPFDKPVFGAPSFGSIATNNNAESPFGKPPFGTSTTIDENKESPFGKPVFGAPSFGSIATNSNAESPFGKPAFGTSTATRSEEHTSELQSLTTISYAVFCLKKKKIISLLILDTTHST
ncbi:uncharacterized protein SCODWIG_03677 [Saccharomycodes ludwigii]|uniref:Nucleoporin Nup159/Nup146 N-terminal domain-containing protein n=1 Tax=Saccharomycodes ludwigii TaxID=36035 RepID=A0A376BBC3_9ASCO|nr:uncharacterized protein SCODWIG_03677 [Saccharomycodes ludwigii]